MQSSASCKIFSIERLEEAWKTRQAGVGISVRGIIHPPHPVAETGVSHVVLLNFFRALSENYKRISIKPPREKSGRPVHQWFYDSRRRQPEVIRDGNLAGLPGELGFSAACDADITFGGTVPGYGDPV
jgi:hypothetical protein